MNYLFEQLGPDKFQEFCQALLVKEFPDLQCYPIRQPDGGRDAIAYFEHSNNEFIIFQVKYVLKPTEEKDPHQWLVDILKSEMPKVKKLIPKGAKGYYLLTNVSGTAHLDFGSLDKVQKIFNDTFDIPARCWWRDDLNRRLDNAPQLKFAYPELMTGQDWSIFITQHYPKIDPQEQGNRIDTLNRVYDKRIKETFNYLLHNTRFIELTKKIVLPSSQTLVDKKIIDLLNDGGGALLILGDAGAGKTTMLLELARQTIAQAKQDFTKPIPVVLELSSWAKKRQPFYDWLIEELNHEYDIPYKHSSTWLEKNHLLLLLDGLDEVREEYQNDCITSINEFRSEYNSNGYGFTRMVICSRNEDYNRLTEKLKLQKTVYLEPLSQNQIETYFTEMGTELKPLYEVLQHDTILQELAKSPLMLDIMVSAFEGISIKTLQSLDSIDEYRQYLFKTYIKQMFKRYSSPHTYSPKQTIQWLSGMAQKMKEHGQTVFLIEEMQPSWLEINHKNAYILLVLTAIGIIFTFILWIALKWFVFLFFILFNKSLEPQILPITMFVVLIGSGWLFLTSKDDIFKEIHPVEQLRLSWSVTTKDVQNMLKTKFYTLVQTSIRNFIFLGSAALLMNWLYSNGLVYDKAPLPQTHIISLILGILLLAGFTALGEMVLISCLEIVTIPTIFINSNKLINKSRPNEGIIASSRNSVLVLSSSFLFWLAIGLFSNLFGFYAVSVSAFMMGIVGSILLAMRYGGLAVIQHIVLRFILTQTKAIPCKFVDFLNYADKLILLKREGGGYRFKHGLLMDYFAENGQDIEITID